MNSRLLNRPILICFASVVLAAPAFGQLFALDSGSGMTSNSFNSGGSGNGKPKDRDKIYNSKGQPGGIRNKELSSGSGSVNGSSNGSASDSSSQNDVSGSESAQGSGTGNSGSGTSGTNSGNSSGNSGSLD